MFIPKISQDQYINTFSNEIYKKNLKMFKTLLGTYQNQKSNLFVGTRISHWRPLNCSQRNLKSQRTKRLHQNFNKYLPYLSYPLKPPKNQIRAKNTKKFLVLKIGLSIVGKTRLQRYYLFSIWFCFLLHFPKFQRFSIVYYLQYSV